jgi:hypothetical protein
MAVTDTAPRRVIRKHPLCPLGEEVLMLRRRDTLLLVGAIMIAIGGILYFNPFQNEPWWAEWLLASILVYLGLPLAIVGAAIHFFSGDGQAAAPKNRTSTAGVRH